MRPRRQKNYVENKSNMKHLKTKASKMKTKAHAKQSLIKMKAVISRTKTDYVTVGFTSNETPWRHGVCATTKVLRTPP